MTVAFAAALAFLAPEPAAAGDARSLLGDPDMVRQDFASLADGFKVSLVRPPGEAANSGEKTIVQQSSTTMLEDEERKTLDDYDEIFEKYSMFCNGRWLGVQVLQDSQDLMYLQHIVYMKKPDIIIETGTYKGGLTFFFANLLDIVFRETALEAEGSGDATQIAVAHRKMRSSVISVDKHHPHLVFAANWFCPPCLDCRRSYETREWKERVRFVQGLSDSDEVYQDVLAHMAELGYQVDPETRIGNPHDELTVMVNLDANHEYDGLLRELIYYAPHVSLNSYLVVQDAKLDKIWGVPAVSSAVKKLLELLPPSEFVVENELKFHGYSQHIYLRRASKTIAMDYFPKLFDMLAGSA